jgi:hypothetical protein
MHQEGSTIPNMYTLNNKDPKYIKQKLLALKEEIENRRNKKTHN